MLPNDRAQDNPIHADDTFVSAHKHLIGLNGRPEPHLSAPDRNVQGGRRRCLACQPVEPGYERIRDGRIARTSSYTVTMRLNQASIFVIAQIRESSCSYVFPR